MVTSWPGPRPPGRLTGEHAYVTHAQRVGPRDDLRDERVTGLVPYHAPELRLGGTHGEALEVERRLVVLDTEDLRPDIRPIPRHVLGLIEPGDAHLPDVRRLHELHVRGLRPGVHVQQDADAQVARRAVKELHGQPNTGRRPLVSDHDRESTGSTASSGRCPGNDALFLCVCRIDLDAAT